MNYNDVELKNKYVWFKVLNNIYVLNINICIIFKKCNVLVYC